MKQNAGIKLGDINDIIMYSQLYLSAFHKCDLYLDWEPWGDVYRSIQMSHDFMTLNFDKKRIWAFTMDVFQNINNTPWTCALKGKRVLIISPFVESFKQQLKHKDQIYGIDLFPDCKFVFLKPPQTQAEVQSESFMVELNNFLPELENIKDDFDIALCACGGYGNLICSKLYDMNKSAIYVGGVLQMFFGIYGERWLRERDDIIQLYKNKHWKRPMKSEKPEGHDKVEGNCYW